MEDEYMIISVWSGGCFYPLVGCGCGEGRTCNPRAGDPELEASDRPLEIPGQVPFAPA